jgi:AraC-like DNA-binding protein
MESAGRWGLDLLVRFGVPGNPDMRPTLLRVLTELYVQKPTHTADEERHYTELALRLLDAADIGTRAAVAQRLAHYTSPPRRVLERLAAERPIRNGQRQPLWLDGSTMLNDAGAVPMAVDIAITLNELFFAANPDERHLILLNLDVIAPFPAGRMKLSREDSLGGRLEAAVLSRNREAFAQHLAQALHISRSQARRVADDDLGEPIVAAAKALNIRRGALYRILLFVNIGCSVARVQALTELHHELPVQTAEHMVAIWQTLPKVDRPAGQHQPMLWSDDSTRPRTISSIAHHADFSPPEKRDAS